MREIPQKTYYTLWYQDLDKIINEFYEIEGYESLDEIDDFRNGMYHIWDTSDGIEYAWNGEFQEWLEEPVPSGIDPRVFLWDMAEKGHIPKGKYLIHIWW